MICTPDPRKERNYIIEDGEPCFYLKIGDTKQDIEHTLTQGEHALCPQEPRKGYKTCNPVFWAVVNHTSPDQKGRYDDGRDKYTRGGKGLENRYFKIKDPGNPREWYKIAPKTISIEELREAIVYCMNLFKDPNTLLGASQAYPRQLKKLRSLGMEALQGYDTWKTAMTEMLDACNIGKAVTQGDLADLEAPTQIDDIVSTQQILESVGLFEQSGDGGEKEVKSLPTEEDELEDTIDDALTSPTPTVPHLVNGVNDIQGAKLGVIIEPNQVRLVPDLQDGYMWVRQPEREGAKGGDKKDRGGNAGGPQLKNCQVDSIKSG
ncbi:hypothetical protein RBB50_010237 [Rhinocladiella similis]